ncbi:MAG: UDP-N-acetylmuramoyl-L-alanyl-D-glutamate--2,6-diaminopimelate ligase [Candidatus Krumholzibacteria bacterium]|nr:UDP-N-acetylmuramoyl-L-alanyl-D-glutamate--2,6-diaminopimelate ligase [Candidatus Krumholzibacteria bacterium]
MKLSRLFDGIETKSRLHFRDVEVAGIAVDSRALKVGDCFVAIKGHAVDGLSFVADAVQKGASALVVERAVAADVPTLVVEDPSSVAAQLARRFYGDPASRLVLAGITGTNGKTSSAFLLRSILDIAHGPCGVIGTVGYGISDEYIPTSNTTPGAVDLYRTLDDFTKRGCRSAVMEVSSHAAVQGRINGLEFDVGAFTNLTRDHLDYHGSFEEYIRAKETFVATLTQTGRKKRPGTFVYNADDPEVVRVAERFAGRKISFGLSSRTDVRAERLRADLRGTCFDLIVGSARGRLELKLLGRISAYNAITAAACAHALDVGMESIKEGLEKVAQVPGRFQVVSWKRGPTVVVDFAHTPDALEKLLNFCRELQPRKIVTVFGCGGDRDRGKRPLMGSIAARLSGIVFVTDDNPRTEDPDRIVKEILDGIESSVAPVHVVRDRREAIRRAVGSAVEGDLVVIAGKGHENAQILKNERVPFNDAHEAEEALKDLEVDHQG